MERYLRFDFNIQNNSILIISKIVEGISMIATKNAIIKRAMELFATNTDIDITKIDKDGIKKTKRTFFLSITEESKNSIDNFIKFQKDEYNKEYSIIEVNPIIKKDNKINITVRYTDGTTQEIEAQQYKTKVEGFENFNLAIHKDGSKWVITDVLSGIKLIHAQYKKDLELTFKEAIERIGLDVFIKHYNKQLEKLGLLKEEKKENKIEPEEIEKNELKDFVCCDYENKNLFGKKCTIIDNTTYYEYYVVDIEGKKYKIYKGDICNKKIDILNKIIFKLSDYSDLYIKDIKDMEKIFTIEGVEITLNKEEVNNCNNFKELYKLAERIINELFNEGKNNNDIKKEENKKIFLVGNLNFNDYNEAYKYCIGSDFDPDLMIKSINNGTLKTNKLHNNKVKIKLLDNKINRLVDRTFILKKEIDKQGIKYNDKNNILLQQLEKLNNNMDSIEMRIDELVNENRSITSNNFKLNLAALKEEYGDNKYKVINNITGSITYTNNLESYLYNKDYTIKIILDNTEICKQCISSKNGTFYFKDTYTLLTFKNNDTVNYIEKEEIYSIKDNKLIYKELHRDKRGITITCNNNFININGKYPTHNTLNKAIELFKNDNDIIDILENYTVIEPVKQPKRTIKDKIELMIKDYKEAINKLTGLKKVCDNLECYNNLYRGNLNAFYRKHKTNRENFNKYLDNYRYYNYLLKLNPGSKENIEYKAPLKVVYTKHYNKR
ncbi:hypothetical protein ACSW9O_15205 (plasmid) [Clostridium perfringens]